MHTLRIPTRRFLTRAITARTITRPTSLNTAFILNQCRQYASKKPLKSTSTLVPGSKQLLADEALEEYQKTEVKMRSAVDWFQRECATLETRCSGRVTPALLDSIRVTLPSAPKQPVPLEEVATVGVRDGTTLLVTAFEEEVMMNLILIFPCEHIQIGSVDNEAHRNCTL